MAKKKIKKEKPVVNVQEFYKEVEDDWYPNFRMSRFPNTSLQLVRITCYSGDCKTKICVWGADDDGMEFFPESLIESDRIIKRIIDIRVVSHNWFKQLGFIRA